MPLPVRPRVLRLHTSWYENLGGRWLSGRLTKRIHRPKRPPGTRQGPALTLLMTRLKHLLSRRLHSVKPREPFPGADPPASEKNLI